MESKRAKATKQIGEMGAAAEDKVVWPRKKRILKARSARQLNRTETTMNLHVGDKIRILGALGVYHYGVYVGPRGLDGGHVVHNDKNGGVELVRLEEFAARRPVEIVERVARSWYQQEEIAERAISLLGKPYQLVDFNCEHLANYAVRGVPISPAVQGVIAVGVFALALWATAKG